MVNIIVNLLPLCILICFISFSKSNKLLGSFIDEVYFSTNCISVKYGNEIYSNRQYFPTLDLNSSISWIHTLQSIEDSTQRTNYIINTNSTIDYKSDTLYGQEVNRPIYLLNDNDHPITFRFYEIESVVLGTKGILGLNYKFEDDSYSIIHQIKKLGYIDQLSFSFILDQQKRQLFFGGIPDNFTSGRNLSSCDVLPGYSNWNCNLTRIVINDTSTEFIYNFTTRFYLISTGWYIQAPGYYIDYIIEKYLKNYFDNKFCFINGDKPKRFIVCDYVCAQNTGNITFIIGDYSYSIPIKEFWVCGEEFCRFTIRENPNGDEFVLGFVFYQFFNVLFDYEDSKIHFYSYKGIERINSDDADTFIKNVMKNKDIIKRFIIGSIISLIFGLFLICLSKHFNKDLIR